MRECVCWCEGEEECGWVGGGRKGAEVHVPCAAYQSTVAGRGGE